MDPLRTFQTVIDLYLESYAAHDAAGCAALYAEDGEVCSPFGAPARGRAAIEATHRDWFEDGETNKTMTATRAGIEGDLGYCLVQFEADIPGEGGAEGGGMDRFRGTSLNVMRRGADGNWTIMLTSLNELVEQDTESN